MKIITIAILATASLQAGLIRTPVLNFRAENILRVSRNEPLTVVMPFIMQQGAIAGGAITSNPEQEAPFYIRASGGTAIFNLRALQEVGETTINVIAPDNRVAVLRLIVDEKGNDSVVTYRDREGVAASRGEADYHPYNVSAYLERTFLYPLLRKADSELIVSSEEFGYEESISELDSGVELDLKTAVRWDDPHPRLVVFNSNLVNQTEEEFYYDRHSFEVLVGANRYRPAVSHSSGVIQGGGTHPIQLCLSENDYPDITNIDLSKNAISFALSFEPEAPTETNIFSGFQLLPPLDDTK